MKRLFLYTVALIFSATAFSQTIVKINGKDISKDEFEYYYHKNGNEGGDTISASKYLDMFIDFKLKVEEAYAQKLDTSAALKKELEGYRTQLIAPYLTNSALKEQLINQEIERLKVNKDISHILIRISDGDTTDAYNKATEIASKANATNFAELARQYSEDPSAQINGGHLGWSSAMQYIYPFEETAWNATKGSIVGPVRTRFGYHIILVHDERADEGELKLAHILILKPANADSTTYAIKKSIADSVYSKAAAGENFANLARLYSEDNNANMGGELPWISRGATNDYFENAAFKLNSNNYISQPVETPYGWHIIKYFDHREREIGTAQRNQIENFLRNDVVADKLQRSFIDTLKKEYKFKLVNNKKVIAKFAKQKLTRADYEAYCKAHPNQADNLNKFIDQSIYNYENSILETKYPEFGMLMNEYKDGILLFEVSNKEVWKKATNDTEGLKALFDSDRDKYSWPEPRFRGEVIYCADSATRKAALDIVGSRKSDNVDATSHIYMPQNIDEDSLSVILTRAFNKDNDIKIKVEKGLFIKGKNAVVDALMFNEGALRAPEQFPYVFVVGRLDNRPSNYREAKGLVTNDYQEILAKKWRNKLRAKYPVKIYKKVVDKVK